MEGKDYLKMLVYTFAAFGAFIVAIAAAYFATVGLFFGQAVVEGDVFVGGYKYECVNLNETASTCTNLSSTKTAAFQDYENTRTAINATTLLFLVSTTILFSLLGLVFLFIALKSSGLVKAKEKKSKDESF